jgi:hypothetical protein
LFDIKTEISDVNFVFEGKIRFGMHNSFFSDLFYYVIVEHEPFTIELGVINVKSFMNVCADMGDSREEIVRAISFVRGIGEGVEGVWCHVQTDRKSNLSACVGGWRYQNPYSINGNNPMRKSSRGIGNRGCATRCGGITDPQKIRSVGILKWRSVG